jgi:hypothetical protein
MAGYAPDARWSGTQTGYTAIHEHASILLDVTDVALA